VLERGEYVFALLENSGVNDSPPPSLDLPS
jgi:hypothetical protein